MEILYQKSSVHLYRLLTWILKKLRLFRLKLGSPTDASEASTLYQNLLERVETDLAIEQLHYRTYVDFDNVVLPVFL